MKAFPSYIQAYSKHQAIFIFRITELDIPSIAYSWGLLKLPRMPELKSRDINWTPPSINVISCPSYLISSGILTAMRIPKRNSLDGMLWLRNRSFERNHDRRKKRGQRRRQLKRNGKSGGRRKR